MKAEQDRFSARPSLPKPHMAMMACRSVENHMADEDTPRKEGEEMSEKAREAVLLAMKDDTWTDNLRDAILGGSSTSASEGSDHMDSSTSDEDEDGEDENGASTGAAGPSEPAPKPASRRFIGFDDDDDEFMSDSEEEEEPEGKGKGKARA